MNKNRLSDTCFAFENKFFDVLVVQTSGKGSRSGSATFLVSQVQSLEDMRYEEVSKELRSGAPICKIVDKLCIAVSSPVFTYMDEGLLGKIARL